MIRMHHIVSRSELIQFFQGQCHFSRTGFITFQIIFMKTIKQLMVCEDTEPQCVIYKTFMNSTFYGSKINLITPILKNRFDTICLLHAVTADIKRIAFFQIILKRRSYQIEILMKDRLGRCIESNAGIGRSGRFITKFQPAEIKCPHSKLAAVYQFPFQCNAPILFGLLNGYCLWSQRLIVYHLNSLAQPKKITHCQSSLFRDKIQKRSRYISCHRQIGNDRHSIFLLTG